VPRRSGRFAAYSHHFADTEDPGLELSLRVGFLVFAIGLSLGGPTGYAINPARDLMPRIAHFLLPAPGKGPSDWAYAWVPVIALAGGMLGALAYDWWYPG
jgi:glycerol uptake facilitator protein